MSKKRVIKRGVGLLVADLPRSKYRVSFWLFERIHRRESVKMKINKIGCGAPPHLRGKMVLISTILYQIFLGVI